MDGAIASAVVLPEPEEPEQPQQPQALPPSPTSLKRRQSSVSEQETKRQRVNSTDDDLARRTSTSITDAAPPVTKRRERGRERRLFGNVLDALSKTTVTPAQKRRSEIEKKQQTQRKIEEQESSQKKLELDKQRTARRLKEHETFERESMRIRHENVLHMAHFLRTKAEPHLYYKPWETTQDEDDRIQDQIAEARDIIRQEQEANEALRQDDDAEREASHHGAAGEDAGAGTATSGKHHDADSTQQQPTANGGGIKGSDPLPKDLELKGDHAETIEYEAVSGALTNSREQKTTVASHDVPTEEYSRDAIDDGLEEVVEAAEDTVIY
ncbi:hypothetical protein EJ04DRAFT_511398 [Polyplosphaeria fusca]|uniref:Pinin/SDK/MemA protein domain-containing protein n=1 Tax=Polyplosphaeria fusca TaxID=682080 RepID=A0A9P4R0P0_9PLEO|nr:hypothetical protein EJ04DRAFT_511398 [Polyplosphaeria fusca]